MVWRTFCSLLPSPGLQTHATGSRFYVGSGIQIHVTFRSGAGTHPHILIQTQSSDTVPQDTFPGASVKLGSERTSDLSVHVLPEITLDVGLRHLDHSVAETRRLASAV